jgi:hypothetical protein
VLIEQRGLLDSVGVHELPTRFARVPTMLVWRKGGRTKCRPRGILRGDAGCGSSGFAASQIGWRSQSHFADPEQGSSARKQRTGLRFGHEGAVMSLALHYGRVRV